MKRLLVIFTLFFIATLPALTHAQSVIYVDASATGTNNGASWANAYTSLQDALAAATGSDQLWIADGVYYPDVGVGITDNDRNASFTVTGDQDGLKIYGGFAGNESQISQRAPHANVTTLSGDINGDGALSANSYHVVVFDGGDAIGANMAADISGVTVLDGVTVTGGNADKIFLPAFPDNAGGGIFCDGKGADNACSPTIAGVSFVGNSATGDGGAIYNDGRDGGQSSPAITNTTFTGNSADFGAAILNNGRIGGQSSPVITNTTFISNSAKFGGAIYNNARDGGQSSPVITNVTFTGNSASNNGGAIYSTTSNGGQSSSDITNSIFYGNGDEIFNNSATPTISYSLVEGSGGSGGGWDTGLGSDGGNNIDADPQFADSGDPDGSDDAFATPDDGLRLSTGSPALNVGNNVSISASKDITGADRIQNVIVDLGAYEGGVDPALTIYVDASATGADDGASWADAYASLQDALAAATGNDEIWIAEGVYIPGLSRTASFTVTGVQDGLKIYGGFASGDTFADRNPGDHPVVLSGDDNSFHVLLFDGGNFGDIITADISGATVLDGVTVTGGYADRPFPDNVGGGLYCDGTGSGNTCSPTITGVTFTGNFAQLGGAIYNNGNNNGVSNPSIVNSIFTGNSATEGGAIYNSSLSNGQSSPVITNTTFTGNSASNNGGALYSATSNGGQSSPDITNSIFYGNGDEIFNNSATPTLSHTLVQGGCPSGADCGDGSTIIDADPLFANAADPDGADNTFATSDDGLRLLPGSPALDAGENGAIPTGITTDITGAARTQNGTVDMGAYEGVVDLALTIYVDVDAIGADNGTSWSDAYASLQNALGAATGNDQIWIAEGTYYPDEGSGITDNDRTASFTVTGDQDGLKIYGGFESGDVFANRSPGDHPVVLSGDIGTTGDASDNSYHVLLFDGGDEIGSNVAANITGDTFLDGVTITGGNGNGSFPNSAAGGLFCDGSGPGNACNPAITGVAFAGNSANFGGAILNYGGNDGQSSPTINNATFTGNSASSRGGAIYNFASNGQSNPSIINSTFSSNSASDDGGAVYSSAFSGQSNPTITNSIFYGNGDEIFNANGATPIISYSLVEGGVGNITGATDGGNNLGADPLFVNSSDPDGPDNVFATADDGLRLQVSSPVIDAGNKDVINLPATDITGRQRFLGDAPDIGAYEASLTVAVTGSEGWRMMTAPADNMSYAALLDSLWLQGMPGGDTENGAPNLYKWNEAAQEFDAVADASSTPDVGSGFIVYVYDDQDFDGTNDGFPKTLAIDQARTGGTITPTLSYTDSGVPDSVGWNLIGNPYGATINWNASNGWTKTNLDASFYVWNASAGQYQSHNGMGGTLPSSLIAPWQGFWVKATAASPALEFTHDVRSAGGVFLKNKPVPQIQFELNGKQIESKAVVMFNEKAAPGKDLLDAWKLQSLSVDYLSLYTTSTGGQALDINALPLGIEQPLELTMNFEGSDLGGEYTLSWNPKALPKTWPQGAVMLTDLYTDRIIDLSRAGEYTFKVVPAKSKGLGVQPPPNHSSESEASTLGQPRHGPIPTVLKGKSTNPRFLLTINPAGSPHRLAGIPEAIELAQNYPNPFNPETVIRYGVPEQSSVQLTVFDILGRKVATLLNEQKTPGRYQVNFDASRFASGLYLYRLKVGSRVLTKKMMLIK